MFPLTLSIYTGRVFGIAVLNMLAALTALASLFDFIELLRRSISRPQATFVIVSEIAGLRMPWTGMQILPFAVLLGGILAFWRLARNSELIVVRAAGVSVWSFLGAPVFFAMVLGAAATALISPISAVMRAEAEQLDGVYIRGTGGPLSLNGSQLWLRQSDQGLVPKGVAFIHALSVRLSDGVLHARGVSVFREDENDRFIERIEASSAELGPRAWVFEGARTIVADHMPDAPRRLQIATDLTVSRVQESFASPDTFSVWALPGFIAMLDRSGFSSIRHRLHFHSLLALPMMAATMTLVAAGFSMRTVRRGGVGRIIASGCAAGFLLFVASKVTEEFGNSGVLPPMLAAWAPAIAGMLLSVALLLHLEDG